MKLAVLSDLHLTVAEMAVPELDCDLVILAGDLARPEQAIAWARAFPQPVIYVPGNHEYYGGSFDGTLAHLRELAAGSRIHVLERDELRIAGVRFLCCTLWSDFRLGIDAERAAAIAIATEKVRDFSRIRLAESGDALFTPLLSRERFDASVAWLESKFAEPWDGTTVVVTHHAPSTGSINPKYVGSPLNACFVSDLDERLRRWQPPLWIHGHLHDSYDYRVGATRVLCNPRGYVRNGVPENPTFDPRLVVQV
ncbi:MAG: Ser/Thr protein phosphatase family protein [Burkholderiaceae bacterium]|jgi:predicted phosphodiesterase|nr:MAG: Ser/Thr protein phosphatase family protein [Burkholderiaceae bacterium]